MTLLPATSRASPLLTTLARTHSSGSTLLFTRSLRRSVYPPPSGQQNPKNKAAAAKGLGPWAGRGKKEASASRGQERSGRGFGGKVFDGEERRFGGRDGERKPGGWSRDRDGGDRDRKPRNRSKDREGGSFDRKPNNWSRGRDGDTDRKSDWSRDRDVRDFDRKPNWSSDRDSFKGRESERRGESLRSSRYNDRREPPRMRNDPLQRHKDPLSNMKRAQRGEEEPEFEPPYSPSGVRTYKPVFDVPESPLAWGEESSLERPWGPRREIIRTHPDSEFIYGTSVVEAAIKSGRREIYKLYIYAGANREPETLVRDAKMKRLAKANRVNVVDEFDIGLLDSMANSRPHNGYVLECSPLHKTPILSLLPLTQPGQHIPLELAQHDNTQPDLILKTLAPSVPPVDADRYPFILMLDSVLDPGNLGAILRSAYFLGAAAVMFSGTHSAPLSPVCLKASSGAAEFMPILTYKNPVRMIENSIANGWQFYAAVSPTPVTGPGKEPRKEKSSKLESMEVKQAVFSKPTVVVLGAEGQGMSTPVRKACDKAVTIGQSRGMEIGLDSLNVSVAAALLCQGFLGRHFGKANPDDDRLF